MSVFATPEPSDKRLRFLVAGGTSTGKTVTSLQFPNVVTFDPEKGTNHYFIKGKLEFDRVQTTDLEKIDEGVEELLANLGNYKTVVFDSFTVWYNLKEAQYLKKLRMRKGTEAVLGNQENKAIKFEAKVLLNKLLSLDANLIVVCQMKPKYIKGTGNPGDPPFVQDGYIFDGPDSIAYMFDTVFMVQKDKETRRNMATLYEDKDRTGKFLGHTPFEFNYQNIVALYGNTEELEREPVQLYTENNLAERTGRKFLVTVNGKQQRTAGVSGDTLERLINQINNIVGLGMTTQETIMADLKEKFQIQSLAELREDEGKFVLEDLQNTLING